jgi:REP element-mobilizing transposase RayT
MFLADASGYDVWRCSSLTLPIAVRVVLRMDDPLAFFLTWNTYGTGCRAMRAVGSNYHHGWQLPDPILERECQARMTEDACVLTREQREAVEAQVAETCQHRHWVLHAVNCRTNHVHVVLSAPNARPGKIRSDLKAWATRCLKERFNSCRENWWAERGSIRHIFDEDSLEAAILYVTVAQDMKTFGTRSVSKRP